MSTLDSLEARLKAEARRLGFELAGICSADAETHYPFYASWLNAGYHAEMGYLAEHLPLKKSVESVLPGTQSIVAVGLNYWQPSDWRPGMPRIAAYARGRDYHKVLRSKLRRLGAWLQEQVPEAAVRPCVDSAPVFEREYAHLAGLGWFGKNTCLIDSRRGSWFFIGLLLTTAELLPDKPAIGGCGTCMKCIEACPTGAIVFREGRWQVDARRCISYLTIEHRGPIDPDLAAQIGSWTFGCDDCQTVCPFNTPRTSQPDRAVPTSEADFLAERNWPSLVELANLDESDWERLSSGSAIRRTGLEGIRRNARINLENLGRLGADEHS